MRLFLVLLIAGCAFGQSSDEKAWQTLDKGLHDSNPLKRKQSILAMSLLRPEPRPVALIEPTLGDKDTGVREAACATLGEIKSRPSIPKLQMALADAAPEVIFPRQKLCTAWTTRLAAMYLWRYGRENRPMPRASYRALFAI